MVDWPEYPEYPVGLGEQRPVHHGEAQAHTEPLQGAAGEGRLGQQQEGVEEAEQHARQQHIRQFPPFGVQ